MDHHRHLQSERDDQKAAVRDLLELIVATERGGEDPRIAARLEEVVAAVGSAHQAPFADPDEVAWVALQRELRGLCAAHLAGLLDDPPAATGAEPSYPVLFSALRSLVARHLPHRLDDLEWLRVHPAQVAAIIQAADGQAPPAHKLASWALAQLVGSSPPVVPSCENSGGPTATPRQFDGSFDSGEAHVAVALRALGASVESSILLSRITRLLRPLAEVLGDDLEGQAQLLSALSRAVGGAGELDDPLAGGSPRWPEATSADVARKLAIEADLLPVGAALQALLRTHRGVFGATALGDPRRRLDEAEERVATGFAACRREAFVAGRLALADALLAAGHRKPVVVADHDGVPVLPDGYTGSIAHKHGRAVAVVAPTPMFTGVGVDLEFVDDQDEAGLANVVSVATEAESFDILAAHGDVSSPATVLLAAKEAVFKAVFPSIRRQFDFDDLALVFDRDARRFHASRFPGSEGLAVVGQYALAGRWVLALAIAGRKVP